MQVSRADIPTEYLADYAPDERFLKLPVDKYLNLLGITPSPPQIAIINAINNPKYRFICAALSRRTGKTYIANVIAQLVALVPSCNILIMSPNYNLSGISFDLQRNLLKEFNIEVTRDNSKDRIIEISNSSMIRMGSVNQVDSAVGRSYNLILFDEAALSDGMDAFEISLRPTLDLLDSKGREASKVIFISTPRGRNNWFSKIYERGWDTDPKYSRWVSIHATWKDNPRALVSDIEEARATMSENYFRQEYEADFTVFEGQIWPFDRDECVRDLSDVDFSSMEVIAGLDVGFRDPTAMVIIAFDHITNKYYIVDEFRDSEKTTAKQAKKIKSMENKWNVDYIFIDSAAAQTKYDFAQEYDINTINAKKARNEGISFVEGIIERNDLIVDQKCKHVLACLDQYRWDPNPNLIVEKPVHDEYSHMADAIRYAIYTYEASALSF